MWNTIIAIKKVIAKNPRCNLLLSYP